MPAVVVVVAMVVVVVRSGEEENLVRSRRLMDLSQHPLVRCCLQRDL
jgi:hypothetical protein